MVGERRDDDMSTATHRRAVYAGTIRAATTQEGANMFVPNLFATIMFVTVEE
ncbi:hypothetical protein ACFWC5_09735 [Streptomyces sp. NPDC060085]|uniref:hypothetical protein n=1 Tax=Streptomyces sp. NPDC060085 TaxID=3347054 RepID=UPI00365D6BC0